MHQNDDIGRTQRMTQDTRPADNHGLPVERRKENETTVLRKMVNLMLRHQDSMLKQQRSETFWKNVRWGAVAISFTLLAIVNLLGFAKLSGFGSLAVPTEDYVAMVKISGMIAPEKPANALAISEALDDAFADEKAKGVMVLINSPGGTPTQADLIYKELRSLQAQYPKKRVIAVAEDLAASGAYYIAAAAKEFYVNENSIVGSIGVKMESYGLVDVARKLGVERRIFTAGEHKVRIDDFMPVTDEDRNKITTVLSGLHSNFISAVKAGRGDRLKGDEKALFSGDFWTGNEAVALGLADGIAAPTEVVEKYFKAKVVRDYTPVTPLFARLQTAVSQIAMDIGVSAHQGPVFMLGF